MQKYFIITNKSKLYNEYFDYINNVKIINNFVKKFLEENNIESSKYCADNDQLYIIPTDKDLEQFKNIFTKTDYNEGLKVFKKNSKINKNYINMLKENNLKVLHKPMFALYFQNIIGHFSERLFHIEDILYGSLEGNFNIETPEGFQEIKASEFHKAIEEDE